jgi:uncharacterized membrane protein YbhN (UPF0104 family)
MRVVAAAGLAVVLLAAAAFTADLDGLGVAVEGRALGPIAAVSALYLGNGALKTLRWWLLLRAAGRHASFQAAYGAFLTGMAVNNLLPSGLGGEPVRVLRLDGRVSRTGLAVAGADRILDLAVLGPAALLAVPLFAGARPGLVGPVVAIVAVAFLVVAVSAPVLWRLVGARALAAGPSRSLVPALLTIPIQLNDPVRLVILAALYDIDLGLWRALAIVAAATLGGSLVALGGGAGLVIGTGALLTASGAPTAQAAACALVFVATSTWLSFPLGAAAAVLGRSNRRHGEGQWN